MVLHTTVGCCKPQSQQSDPVHGQHGQQRTSVFFSALVLASSSASRRFSSASLALTSAGCGDRHKSGVSVGGAGDGRERNGRLTSSAVAAVLPQAQRLRAHAWAVAITRLVRQCRMYRGEAWALSATGKAQSAHWRAHQCGARRSRLGHDLRRGTLRRRPRPEDAHGADVAEQAAGTATGGRRGATGRRGGTSRGHAGVDDGRGACERGKSIRRGEVGGYCVCVRGSSKHNSCTCQSRALGTRHALDHAAAVTDDEQ